MKNGSTNSGIGYFIAMFVLIVIDKIERQYITLGCGLLTLVLVFGICMHDVNAIVETLNYKTILLQNSGDLERRQPLNQPPVLTGQRSSLLRA